MPRPAKQAVWTAAQSLQSHKLIERSVSVIEADSPTHPPNQREAATEPVSRNPPSPTRKTINNGPSTGMIFKDGTACGKAGLMLFDTNQNKAGKHSCSELWTRSVSSYLPDCPVKLYSPPPARHSHLILQISSPALEGIIRARPSPTGSLELT